MQESRARCIQVDADRDSRPDARLSPRSRRRHPLREHRRHTLAKLQRICDEQGLARPVTERKEARGHRLGARGPREPGRADPRADAESHEIAYNCAILRLLAREGQPRGRPSTRWAMMLRWISEVPPAIVPEKLRA